MARGFDPLAGAGMIDRQTGYWPSTTVERGRPTMGKTKKLSDQASELADRISPHLEAARDKAGPVLADAVEKAGPALIEARDRVMSDVVPVLTAALAAAGDATEDVRAESKRRGKAAVAALAGQQPPPKKSHKLRRLLVFLGITGLAAAIVKKMSDRPARTQWHSTGPTAAPPSTRPTPSSTAAGATPPPATPAHKADEETPPEPTTDGGAKPAAKTTTAKAAKAAEQPDEPAPAPAGSEAVVEEPSEQS
jgi:hypothetical protein